MTPDGKLLFLDIDRETITRVSDGYEVTPKTWLWPPIIDSHVHLALFPVANELAKRGIGGAVDLASPERTMSEETFFVLTADPREDVNALLEPSAFFSRGHSKK